MDIIPPKFFYDEMNKILRQKNKILHMISIGMILCYRLYHIYACNNNTLVLIRSTLRAVIERGKLSKFLVFCRC